MLRINLLPESARRAGLSPVEQLHRTPLMWLALGLMVALALSLWIPVPIRTKTLKGLNAKVAELQPKKAEVVQLQRVLQQLRTQQTAFEGMGKGEDMWAKRLNVLSNMTPESVWYTELSMDETKGLVIQGSALEQVSVTRLVQDLKADPDFTAAVKDIQIESIKSVPEGEVEVVQFTLACSLRGAPAKP